MESDFAKHVKSPQLERVYLLCGTQPYLIANYEKLLVKKALGGEFNDFNLHRFEGDSLDLQAFYDAVESLPFFSEGRCVTLDLDPDKLDAGQLDELCGVLADPPRTTTVVITVKNPPAKREKLARLVKACDGAGCVVELGSRRSSDTLRFLRDRAQKNGCELESPVASYMVERCTDDLQLLSCELDKLCAYVGGGRIERADVDAVVTTVLQAKVFDLSKAILRGRFDAAMELVDQLIYLREPAGKVLAERAAAELGYAKNRTFAIKNAMSDSGGYTAGQLGKMLTLLADADMRLKSTGGDDRVVLEETITKLFLLTGKRAG